MGRRLLVVAGVAFLSAGFALECFGRPEAVAPSALAAIRAGSDTYCAVPVTDTSGCGVCLTDNNGGSGYCEDTAAEGQTCETGCYTGPTTPRCELTTTNCGGTYWHYTGGGCNPLDFDYRDPCGRTYQAGTVSYVTGVSCSGYCP